MKVVFMGTPDFSVGTLEALVEAGYEITGVVTQPDKPKGRGKQIMPTPVKEAADYSKRDFGYAEIRMHQRSCIPASGLPRSSADPVGCHERR